MNNDAFIVQIISIHAPAKGATYFDYLKVSVRIFQSTLPRRERRASYETRTSGRCYFNPRSREGSDSSANSIINRQTLFQSTLPRRERHPAPLPSHPLQHFNPRSREGSDVPQDLHLLSALCISIHAPAKGATWQAVRSRRVSHFNPRSREGSDEHPAQLWARLRHFNPRSREGSDRIAEPGTYDVASISIHAPAKGATASVAHTHRRRDDFNPRSREGSDHTTVLDS